MKQFFEEYGGIIIIIIVIAALLFILGSGGETPSGLVKTISDAINTAVSNFTGFITALPGA